MLKSFAQYYKPHMGLFFLDMICALLIAITDLLFPQGTRYVIDNIIPDGNINLLVVFGVVFLILYGIRFLLDYIVTYYGHVLGVRIEYDMRKKLFAHMQRFSFRFFDETKIGQLMSRIVNDLNEITELAHHGPEDVFISIVTLVGAFILLLFVNVPLTLIIFAIIPFMIWFTIKVNTKMKKNFRSIRKTIGNVNSQVEESLLGIRVVQSFTNEEYEKKKFDKGNQFFRDLRSEGFRLLGLLSGGITFFAGLLTLVSVVLGGIFVINGAITLGDLFAYTMYMAIMIQPVKKITFFAETYQKGMAGYHRYVEMIEMEPEIEDKPTAIQWENPKGKVTFEDVSFKYADEGDYVLNHINLDVKAGETIALVGPSGVGKTTLCQLIPRFYEINEGRILVDDLSIQDIKMDSLRQHIGVVAQDVFLFSGTIGENIKYGNLEADDEAVEKAAKHAFIHDFILSLDDGYDTYVGERGIKLSGGQKQRLAIARMFLKNPAILIFDEATSALDNRSEKVVQASMETLSKGRTTFIIAHRLSTIRKANRIVVLTEEGIAEIGNHAELMKKQGVYYHLYQAAFES